MERIPREEQELKCPRCYGEADTIHPYYTATQHLLFLGAVNPYTWWIVIGLLTAIFWPIGIVAYIVLYIYEVKTSKNKALYKCSKCNIQFSYNEASNAANNAT